LILTHRPSLRGCVSLARNDLTKAQRKAYAAEVGQLITKLTSQSNGTSGTDTWFIELVQKASVPRQTAYNRWHAFCTETDRTISGGI
jgi:hypothetical protein